MKKNVVRILTAVLMLSVVFSSSVFAAEKQQSAWDSFVGFVTGNAVTVADTQVDGVTYRTHIQNDGWAQGWVSDGDMSGSEGRGLRLEGIEIKIDGDTLPDGLGITYRTHIENDGWAQGWVEDGEMSGSYGRGLRLEAIEIKLTGDNADDYTVLYRTHIQNDGWAQGWVADGELSGSEGRGLRLEGIEIKIEQKTADLTAYNAAKAAVTQADYTAASWTAYQAVVNANVVDEDNLQSEVDAATAAITAAQANLVLVPKVTSVTAINAKQIQIAFNKPVNTTTVIGNTTTGALVANTISIARTVTDGTYPNKNVTASDSLFGTFSADGKTLTVTVDSTSAKYFDGSYSVTVANSVKDTTATAFQAYASVFTYADTVAPTVTAVEYNTTTSKITMTFSEPLSAVPSIVRLDGTPVAGAAFKANTNQTVVEVSKPASVAAGTTKSLYVAGATDRAGNALVGFTGNVTFPTDTTALAIASITQTSSNTATIVFNKSLAAATNAAALNAAFSEIVDGTAIGTAFTYAIDTTDTSNKTVIATYAGTAPNYFYGTASSKTVTFVVLKDSLSDVFGNKIADATQAVSFTKDVTGPVITSATLSDDGKYITLQANEKLTGTAGTTQPTLEALRIDGVDNTSAYKATLVNDVNGNLTQIKVDTTAGGTVLVAGTYTIRFAAGAITDLHTNASLAIANTVTVGGTTADLTAAIATASNNHFTVTYSAAVTAASALSASNYSLDGKALPTGTDIYFDSSFNTTKVHIVLPTGSINIGAVGTGTAASLGVSGVQSTTGKTVVTKYGDVTVQDNTSAKIKSVTVMGNSIFVKFDESVAGTPSIAALTDFAIQVAGTDLALGTGGSPAAVSAIVTGQTDTVQITITPGSTGSNWDATKTIGVKYIGTVFTDANLFTVAAGTAYTTN